MSYLLIDVGNTRAKAVVSDGLALGPLQVFPDEFVRPAELQGVLFASVASDERINELKTLSGLDDLPWTQLFSAATAFGLTNCYEIPTTLGVDRWLAMLGAMSRLPNQPLLVVDAGTAMTVDHVSIDGQHQGGWILPGLRMQHKAVTSHTAKVFSREFDEAQLSFGQNTDQCLKHGILAGLCGVIQQAAQLCPAAHILLTGGDAEFLQQHLQQSAPNLAIQVDPWLIFRGMQRYVEI